MRRFQDSRSRSKFTLFWCCFWGLIGFVLAGVIYYGFVFYKPHTPAKSLALAVGKIDARNSSSPLNENEYDEINNLLIHASKNEALAHWVNFYMAKISLASSDTKTAVSRFSSIPQTSGAWLDASVAMLEITDLTAFDPSYLQNRGSMIAQLDLLLENCDRKDLMPRLLLVKVREAINSNFIELALSIIEKIRDDYPDTPFAHTARELQKGLLQSLPQYFDNLNTAQQFAEVSRLTREGAHADALGVLYETRKHVSETSPAYFETLLLEEQVLRAQKRPQEADHVLSLIATQNMPGYTDVALLQSAKNAWNINDYQQALNYISALKNRFGQSPLIAQARYVEARVLEEMKLLPDAKESYNWVVDNSNNIQEQLQALQRLALLYMRDKSDSLAAKTFERVREQINEYRLRHTDSIPDNTYSEIENSLTMATFWLAFFDVKNRPIRLQELKAVSPYGYYNWMARNLLNDSSNNILNDPMPNIDNTALLKDTSSYAECIPSVDEAFLNLVQILSSEGLRELTQKEIDYSYRRSELLGTRAWLSINYGLVHEGVNYARSATKILARINDTTKERCASIFHHMSFPLPYRAIYEQASKEAAVPMSLLYGISRAESSFNTKAQSRAGAIGVMQLLPSTTAQMGVNDAVTLFDAKQNIQLGARHLATLLKKYNGNLAYAVAAYNAGSTPVDRWLARYSNSSGQPPSAQNSSNKDMSDGYLSNAIWIEHISFPETKRYVKEVLFSADVYNRLLTQP